MLFSKEYVGYLARQVTQKLIAGEFIEAKSVSETSAALNNALLEELQLEDRINDEVRVILEAFHPPRADYADDAAPTRHEVPR